MSLTPFCILRRGTGPLIAAALHNGHDTRPRVHQRLLLDEKERLREEDPFTAEWTQIAPTQILGLRSRFEVDLNRSRNEAVYTRPEDAWGLNVWKTAPDQLMIETSLREYDLFYATIKVLFRELIADHARIVILDLHTYNHRRVGPDAPPAPAEQNPEVNVGTGTVDRARWGSLIQRVTEDLKAFNFCGRSLDVRENVKFRGGYFSTWVHETFPTTACAIAIEFKKFFMDEWTGQCNLEEVELIYQALESTVPGIHESLRRMQSNDN